MYPFTDVILLGFFHCVSIRNSLSQSYSLQSNHDLKQSTLAHFSSGLFVLVWLCVFTCTNTARRVLRIEQNFNGKASRSNKLLRLHPYLIENQTPSISRRCIYFASHLNKVEEFQRFFFLPLQNIL